MTHSHPKDIKLLIKDIKKKKKKKKTHPKVDNFVCSPTARALISERDITQVSDVVIKPLLKIDPKQNSHYLG